MLSIAFFVVQVLSILVAILFIHEYKRITHKHESLMDAIDAGSMPSSTLRGTITHDENACMDMVPHPNRIAREINQLRKLS